jgi:glutathione S-transferase
MLVPRELLDSVVFLGVETPNGFNATGVAYFAGVPGLIRNLIANRVQKEVVQRLVARDIWRGGPEECWTRLAVILDDLDTRAPETGFFLGPDLTRADLALFAQLHSFRTALTPVQQAMVERRPRLVAWLDRVDEVTRGTNRRSARTADVSMAEA